MAAFEVVDIMTSCRYPQQHGSAAESKSSNATGSMYGYKRSDVQQTTQQCARRLTGQHFRHNTEAAG